MRESAPGAGDALARVHAQAQTEAVRLFGDGPATPWQPQVPKRTAVRWALLATACAAAAVWVATVAIAPAAVEALAIPAPAGHREIPLSNDIVDAEPAPPPPARPDATPPRQSLESASLVVARAGATWRIDARRASRLEAARQLARLSGSPLLGALDLIARTRPLDLRWQGRDLAGAWQEVLGSELNYALQCRRDRCRAWIVAAAVPRASDSSRPAVPPIAMPESQPLNDSGDVPDRLARD